MAPSNIKNPSLDNSPISRNTLWNHPISWPPPKIHSIPLTQSNKKKTSGKQKQFSFVLVFYYRGRAVKSTIVFYLTFSGDLQRLEAIAVYPWTNGIVSSTGFLTFYFSLYFLFFFRYLSLLGAIVDCFVLRWFICLPFVRNGDVRTVCHRKRGRVYL